MSICHIGFLSPVIFLPFSRTRSFTTATKALFPVFFGRDFCMVFMPCRRSKSTETICIVSATEDPILHLILLSSQVCFMVSWRKTTFLGSAFSCLIQGRKLERLPAHCAFVIWFCDRLKYFSSRGRDLGPRDVL